MNRIIIFAITAMPCVVSGMKYATIRKPKKEKKATGINIRRSNSLPTRKKLKEKKENTESDQVLITARQLKKSYNAHEDETMKELTDFIIRGGYLVSLLDLTYQRNQETTRNSLFAFCEKKDITLRNFYDDKQSEDPEKAKAELIATLQESDITCKEAYPMTLSDLYKDKDFAQAKNELSELLLNTIGIFDILAIYHANNPETIALLKDYIKTNEHSKPRKSRKKEKRSDT